MEFATAYLLQQKNALEKWKGLNLGTYPSIKSKERHLALMPFYGTKVFNVLNEKTKEHLYWGFVQFVAEALIVFEQMLLKAAREFARQNPKDARMDAMRAFALEEFYHLRAYRNYLNKNEIGFWPRSLVSRDSRILKNFYAYLLKKEPLCILLPGAKSELFSVQYTKLLKRCFGTETSDWLEINLMHTVDEVHHYGFDFKVFDTYIQEISLVRKWRLIAFTCFMVLGIQFIVITCGIRLIWRSFPQVGTIKKMIRVGQFFNWSVRVFEPYKSTKLQLKIILDKKPFKYSGFFKFLAW